VAKAPHRYMVSTTNEIRKPWIDTNAYDKKSLIALQFLFDIMKEWLRGAQRQRLAPDALEESDESARAPN
jgi:hypothetical protein